MRERESLEAPFSAAHERFRTIEARERAFVDAMARSRLLHHGGPTARAYVLLHGLTTTPAQFSEFADSLYAGGANVLVPRLPRHGHADRMTHDLAALTEGELTDAAREIVGASRGLAAHVTIAGFSAGGLLAAWIAQHLEVDRVVAIAPFLGLGWIPTRFGHLVTRAALHAPNLFLWWHPFERERHAPAHGYPRYATHAVARIWRLGLELIETARRHAPATRDIELVTNASETTVDNRAIARLADAWRTHPECRVVTHRLSGLPPSHDIMEPRRRRPLAPHVYPALLRILMEEAPP